MSNRILKLFILISVGILFWHCSQYKNLDRENLSELYSLDNTLTARYKVYHKDTNSTTVYYQFNFMDFLYLPNRDSSKYYARYKMKYQLFPDIQASRILDSASMTFIDSNNYKLNNSSLGYFELNISENTTRILRIELTDLNAQTEIVNLITIDKTDHLNRQNFLLLAPDGLPEMNNSVSKNKKYILLYNNPKIESLEIRYFNSFLIPPQPPMNDNPIKKITKIRSDSSFSISLKNGVSEVFELPKQGVYHFMADSTVTIGFTAPVFTEGYPWITTPMQMIAPLRYITTSAEYSNLLKSENKKKAVDDFWLKLTSHPDRANAMISIYYNRVQEANMLFGSDREGWLTDRGMIYIVYGPPDKVFKTSKLETWTYGISNGKTGVSFNFYKSTTPFTDNDFMVDRSPSYINSWNSSIEFWRR